MSAIASYRREFEKEVRQEIDEMLRVKDDLRKKRSEKNQTNGQ